MKNRHQLRNRSIDLKSARRILGAESNSYDDEQLENLVTRLYAIAEWFISK